MHYEQSPKVKEIVARVEGYLDERAPSELIDELIKTVADEALELAIAQHRMTEQVIERVYLNRTRAAITSAIVEFMIHNNITEGKFDLTGIALVTPAHKLTLSEDGKSLIYTITEQPPR